MAKAVARGAASAEAKARVVKLATLLKKFSLLFSFEFILFSARARH